MGSLGTESSASGVAFGTEWTREEMEQQTSHMSGAEKVQFFIDKFRVGAVKDFPWFQDAERTQPTFTTHEINVRRHVMVENAHGESFFEARSRPIR